MGGYLKKRIASFGYALQGIVVLFKEEQNARIHLCVAAMAVFLGFGLKISANEWLAIVICIGIVFAMEALNSAIENLADHATKEKHPLIKKAKDLAAAAVFICAVSALVAGTIIFLPKLIVLL